MNQYNSPALTEFSAPFPLVRTCLLVDVPVQTVVLQDKPVLFPFLGEVSLGVSLPPQPALAVPSAQRLAGDPPPAQGGQAATCPTSQGENEPLRRQKLENSLRVCSPLFFFRLFEDDCWYVCVDQKEDKCQAVCETKQNLRHNNTLHSVTQHNTINAMPARILLLVHLLQRPP